MQPITKQQKTLSALVLNGFFFICKTLTVGLLLFIAVLVISQSAVTPISTRLLGMYAVEYTAKTIKPYRHLFPRPYIVPEEEPVNELSEE